MTEKEFFEARAPEIAAASSAAKRKRMIAELEEDNPLLHTEYRVELRRGEAENHLIRGGRFRLTARGKINTYSLFAEHFRSSLSPRGRSGLITPTGLATDATTAAFFADILAAGQLAAFFDFENEAKIFDAVHHSFRFAVSSTTGGDTIQRARLAFVLRHLADLPMREFSLTPEEVMLLNPNTGTLALFRERRDAEITLACYRRHPVLIRAPRTQDSRDRRGALGLLESRGAGLLEAG